MIFFFKYKGESLGNLVEDGQFRYVHDSSEVSNGSGGDSCSFLSERNFILPSYMVECNNG